MFNLAGISGKELSDSVFKSENITEMYWYYRKKPWFGNPPFSGTIEFEKGGTEGKQRFQDTTFDGLMKQMETFISSL